MRKVLLSIGILVVVVPIIYGHIREMRTKVLVNSTHTVLPQKKNTIYN